MKCYIQQYGRQRTGTNYIKALLGRNFRDVVLFDMRFGSKHAPHQSIKEWMTERGIDGPEAFARLLRLDPFWRVSSVPTADPFEWVAQPVSYEEVIRLRDGAIPLHYIVSVKDPYAYVVSLNRMQKGQRQVGQTLTLPHFEWPPDVEAVRDYELVRQACVLFNEAYRSYWPLVHSGEAVAIRYEDVLANYSEVLCRMREVCGLVPKAQEFVDVLGIVGPGIGVSSVPFYRSYYVEKRYMAALSRRARKIIDDTIDWGVMEHYGYCRWSAKRPGVDGVLQRAGVLFTMNRRA